MQYGQRPGPGWLRVRSQQVLQLLPALLLLAGRELAKQRPEQQLGLPLPQKLEPESEPEPEVVTDC